MTKRAAFIMLALAAALPRGAQAAEDPVCAKFVEPLAYNACLASHGPKATGIGTSPVAGSHAAPAQTDPSRPGPRPRVRRWPRVIRGRSRVHMEFQVK